MAKNEAPSTFTSLDDLAAWVNKQMGGEEVVVMGNRSRQQIPRITTGLLSYDLALGGGWPANQWSEIVGNESSGKTALCFQTIAANQAADPEFVAMWVAAEEYVRSYAESFGVDTERLWVVETNEMEIVFDTVLRALEGRLVDMVVIDSLPALVTTTEVNKGMDEASIATGAVLISRFFKKCARAQRRSLIEGVEDRQCTMIAINQWRDKIGVMYGDPRTTPGGKAKNFYFFVRLELSRDEWLTDGSKIENRVGQSIKGRTLKNKTYRPMQSAVADFYFADAGDFKTGQFDTIKDTVAVCLALEIIERRGAYYSYGDGKWQGQKGLIDAVKADPELQRSLRQDAIAAVLSMREESDDEAE